MKSETIQTNQMILTRYYCEFCEFGYPTRELALKCENWCREHGRHNLDIWGKGAGYFDGKSVRWLTVIKAGDKKICCRCKRDFKANDMAYLATFSGNAYRCYECEYKPRTVEK